MTYDDNTRTDVGSQLVTAYVDGGINYEDRILTAMLTVAEPDYSTVVFSGTSYTYDGTERSIEATGVPVGVTVTYTNNTHVDAGVYTATASIRAPGGAEQTFTAVLIIAKAPITTIAFDDAAFIYDGTEKHIVISGALPAGAAVSYTGNIRTNTGNQTATAVVSGGINYEDLTLTAVLEILPAMRSISFLPLPDFTYGDAPYPLNVSSSSGDAIIWSSSDESVAVIEDGELVIVGAGTTVISATLAPNPLYSDHPEMSQAVVVAKASQTIILDAPATVNRDAGTVALDVSTSSGLAVVLAADDDFVARLVGTGQLEILRLGTVRITATQPGDANHEAAEPVTATIRVTDPASDIPVRVHAVVSPNGDGINDFLIIEGIRDYPDNRLYIVSKNGTEVAEIFGYDNGRTAFNGTGSAGSRLPTGTYFYILEVRDAGQWKYKKGYFILRY
ncbi:MAG: gliding motility-associated C-terminal domain-containing protein [Parapedobacter sp.]|nr:MAG: gliding motility-associated C-terminal domain-containing protein [Parapedobacter sp.]